MLMYTSGSSGVPKGVMLTHLNMLTASRSIIEYLRNEESDIILNCLPLSFDYGLYQVLTAFRFGGSVVLENGFAFPSVLLQRLEEELVTGFPIVPAISAILMKLLQGGRSFPHVRYLTNTGQALPETHIEFLRKVFPNARIYSMYGLTECKRVSYLEPDLLERRPASVGRAMPNTQVWIVDDQNRRIESPGIAGELVVRGAHVMKGYWRRPKETDRSLRDGPLPGEKVLYTGDLFEMDPEGYLYFRGRKDEVLKSGAERISPREVEAVIGECSGVIDVAVIGVPDDILGTALKAIVVADGSEREMESRILACCRAALEEFKIPRTIEFRKNLPKNSRGKTDKAQL
jgi:acyl-CoA synthetase (AMP-forming)/AMP-acid ligase II